MKKLLFIAIIIFASLPLLTFSQDSLTGTWVATDSTKNIGYFVFDPGGYVMLINNGDTMGGRHYTVDDIQAKLIYKVDYKTSPLAIDLIFQRVSDDAELYRLLGILQFISPTSIEVRIDFKTPLIRPVDFLPEGNADTVILNKIL